MTTQAISPRRTRGFTLIELIVTMAVAVVVAMVAIPSFLQLMQNNRQVAVTNQLLSALAYARSEATRLRVPVRICASADGSTCSNSNTWEAGWLVYADKNRNSTLDSGEILRAWGGFGDKVTLRADSSAASVTYQVNGEVDSARTFLLCDGRGIDHARLVVILPTGRAQAAGKPTGGGISCSA